MPQTEEQTAARNFFVAYYGPRPSPTGYRNMAERRRWCSVLWAFLDAEEYANQVEALKEACERKRKASDPLAGTAENEVERAEAAAEKGAQLRAIYERVLASGELPRYWQGYGNRPGAKRAAHDFERYLADLKNRQPDQPALFT